MTTTRELRGLSVRQPFAGYIAQGSKRVELRKWSTPYRGDVLVCSSAGTPVGPGRTRLTTLRGFALCIVALHDVVPLEEKHFDAARVPRRMAFSMGYELRRHFAWKLGPPRPVDPFRIRGAQGLFRLPDDIVAALDYVPPETVTIDGAR